MIKSIYFGSIIVRAFSLFSLVEMSGAFILHIFYFIGLCNCSNISNAIAAVVRNFYADSNNRFDIISYSDDHDKLNKIFKSVETKNCDYVPHKVMKIRRNESAIKLNQSAVLLFDTINSLKDFNDKVRLENDYSRKLAFLTITLNASSQDLVKINKTLVTRHQNYLIEYDKYIGLETSSWYTSLACNTSQMIEVNRFNKSSSRWMTKAFFPNMFDNFYGCKLVIGVPSQSPALGIDLHPDGSVANIWGYNALIIQNIAMHLNFTIIYNPYDWATRSYHNKALAVDYRMLSEPIQYIAYGNIFISETYFFQTSTFMVPPGRLYTSFEKLFLPFDIEVWIAILVLFFVAFTTIVILRFSRRSWRMFVYGANDGNAVINLLIHFFGGAQKKLPRFNFARYILMIYILFSLVMR